MNKHQKKPHFLWLILWIFSISLFVIYSFAETNSEIIDSTDYRGLWLTKIKDESIYLLIKKNNLARYIYKDRIDNKVYVATWDVDEDNLLLISSFDFKDLKFSLKDKDLEPVISLKNKHIIQKLTSVPQAILGEWAIPPDYEAPKNKYEPTTYFGLWETQDEKNPRIIYIQDNRTVFCKRKKTLANNSVLKLQGEWHKHGSQLHVAWEDGSYTVIDSSNENKVKLFDFEPGEALIVESSKYALVKKIQNGLDLNTELANQGKFIKEDNISLSGFDYKSLLRFYRGEWVTLDETQPNAIDIIKFNKFGGLNIASDTNTKGSWFLSRKVCLLNLENGIRMRLKHVGSAFLLFVYEANRPLDSFPNKILKTAPLNPRKLDLINTESGYTIALLKQVNLLSTNNERSIPLISNWSNRDTINPIPIEPWWWPIWSDNLKMKEVDSFSENNISPLLTNGKDSIASDNHSPSRNSTETINLINKSKWEWPF